VTKRSRVVAAGSSSSFSARTLAEASSLVLHCSRTGRLVLAYASDLAPLDPDEEPAV
jgi:hypothetical protein